MKLEPNMYVRTKKGTIHKIFEIDKILKYEKEDRLILNEDDWFLVESDLVKSSHNIIDLIQVGDYVNGHKVYDDFRLDTDDFGIDFIEIGVESDKFLHHYIRKEDIKSIVTKEMFSNVAYRVEE